MHYVSYDAALFINGKRSVAESHTEDRKYLCLFHPCNEILKCMYEIFDTNKKQDLNTPCDPTVFPKTFVLNIAISYRGFGKENFKWKEKI